MTSAENSVSEPPNLKPLCGGIPQDPPFKAFPSGPRHNAPPPPPPDYKNLAKALKIER